MNPNQKNIEAQEQSDLEAFRSAIERKSGKKLTDTNLPDPEKRKKKKKKILWITIPSAFIVLCVVAFLFLSYSSIPFFKDARTLWISTALNTGKHHWLADIFPKEEVDRVQAEINRVMDENKDVQGGSLRKKGEGNTEKTERPDDILDQRRLRVGDIDYAGYEIVTNDIEQGLVISEIVGTGNYVIDYTYYGKVVLIDDPSRVYVGTTPDSQKNVLGQRIKEMMADQGAVCGMNASGFVDPAGEGVGGAPVGMCYYDGKPWGNYVYYYGSVVMTTDDNLVVGKIDIWDKYNIRDGIQFGPVLLANGEEVIDEISGSIYGLQPRTAIGQRADGVVVFLVIDGRGAGGSAGCQISDLTKIMKEYNVVNAACCDGGASSVIAYNGELITSNCSGNPMFGRLLPNAWLVRPKTK